jgi:hypothetical protein
MSTGRGWVMSPEEKVSALREGKARGLPDGWRVELDVSRNGGCGGGCFCGCGVYPLGFFFVSFRVWLG